MIEQVRELTLRRMEVLKQIKYESLNEQLIKLGFLNKEINRLGEEIEKLIKTKYKVYFIESPSKKDIEDERNEGKSLTSYFDLTLIPHKYFLVADKNQLYETFNEIAEDVLEINKSKNINEVFIPIIHFSAHGNESFFGMTNDHMTWEELGEELYKLNVKSGIDLTRFISDYIICMSVCNGASLRKVIVEGNGTPFFAMIGSDESISWGDSITAFQVFYYKYICKCRKLSDSIEAMRSSSEFEGFYCFTDKRVRLI